MSHSGRPSTSTRTKTWIKGRASSWIKYLWRVMSMVKYHICGTDSAPFYKTIIVNAKNSTNTIAQASYSPDFSLPESQIAISEAAYKKCLNDWVKLWQMYIASGGAYFKAIKLTRMKNNLLFTNSRYFFVEWFSKEFWKDFRISVGRFVY